MSLNIKLLHRVKQHILDNPKRLRMNNWIINAQATDGVNVVRRDSGPVFEFYSQGWNEPKTQPIPDCGAVACMAGWTVILGDNLDPKTANVSAVMERARELLGITESQSSELFWVDGWNSDHEAAYLEAETADDRAKIVGLVIDDFSERYAAKV